MGAENNGKAPPIMKQSRAKLWIRTVVLAVFFTLFGLAIYQDILAGIFYWTWALAPFLVGLVVGFWMSRLVPMQVYDQFQLITFSFDRVYFSLIWFLVILKVVATKVLGLNILADVLMSGILGLMMGRLSGICLRVRTLKGNFNES